MPSAYWNAEATGGVTTQLTGGVFFWLLLTDRYGLRLLRRGLRYTCTVNQLQSYARTFFIAFLPELN